MNKRTIFIILILTSMIFREIPAIHDEPKNKIRIVVLDAGHGGKDPGAQGKNSDEKDIVLAIALKVGNYIEENFEDVKVVYTRDKDFFIPVYERAEIANKNKADLFISIHANWSSDPKVLGTETFVLGTDRNEKNLEVVMKENSVITLEEDYTSRYEGFDPTSAESYIIFSLMQNTFLKQSLEFASYVQGQFRDRVSRKDRGVKQDIFMVLWKTTMPSVLIETGFVTNASEEKFLMSEDGQTYIASAIYRAFKDYKREIEDKSNFTLAIPDPIPAGEHASIPDTALLPDKVYFMVQIASSSRQLKENDEIFKNFDHIFILLKDDQYKYAVGRYESYDKALELSREIRKNYPGAFVIASKNRKIIPVGDALEQ